jgi:hypothetical protein
MQDKRDRLAHHTTFSEPVVPTSSVALRPGRFDTRQKSLKYKPLETNEKGLFTRDLMKVMDECRDLLSAMEEIETSREKFRE